MLRPNMLRPNGGIMKKLLLIGLKDLRLAFRDRAALIMMLLAPFLLTLGLGAVTGRFSGGSSTGISHIPVVLVNEDGGLLGNELVALFQSKELDELVDPTISNDPAAARKLVDENHSVAVIVIPAGFTDSIIPPSGQTSPAAVVAIEVYTNPTAPTSAGVIKTILDGFLSQVEVERVGGEVAVTQLVASGRIRIQDAQAVGLAAGMGQAGASGQSASITLNNVASGGSAIKFDVLALLAPGMALMFLMYTVSYGGRTLLTERNQGTLPRLLVSPTRTSQILGGKMIGIYFTGAAQMFILILGTTLLFQMQWGDETAVLVLVLAAVFGAVGWGMLITALAKTPGQVNAVGAAIMLTFGILGGTFINMDNMPAWFRMITKITPNAWGVDGFTTLALGGGLKDILTPILALLVMGSALFTVAVLLINRRGLADR
jgi:ABC-2 type transport system permease protein